MILRKLLLVNYCEPDVMSEIKQNSVIYLKVASIVNNGICISFMIMNVLILPCFLLVVFTGCNAVTQDVLNTCYPAVGCFSSLSPWTSMNRKVPPPQHPLNISTYMYYYSRDLLNGTTFAIFPEIDLSVIPHDTNKQTYMIFHGHTGNGTFPWILDLKDSLLAKEDADVFVVEYNQGVRVSYEQAISNARVMGKLAAQVLTAIDIDPSYLHLIGHCVGGQIASYTAKYLKESGNKPARLTALDPAGPLFEGESPMIRLTPEDADLIDVWHTDITYPGIKSPCGHIDFYFNGGKRQPGCDSSDTAKEMITCSHAIAHNFYVEAVSDDCMMGQPADLLLDLKGKPSEVKIKQTSQGCKENNVCVPAGLEVNKSLARGIFIVYTNNDSPYCIPI